MLPSPESLMIIATIFIAIFSGISCLVAYRIHQSTQKRDEEINDILKKLTIATLVGGRGVGYEETTIRSFLDMLKKFDDLEP